VRGDKPLDWLKAGPDRPGWTNPGKPAAPAAGDKLDRARLWAEVLHLLGRCALRLAAYPEARAALAAWLAELPPMPET
jgi:hypothetical protein